jgi:hypothetical protein
MSETVDVLEARWRLGHLLSTELADAAVEILQSGHDCDAVWELACTDVRDLPWQGAGLFERALEQLGRSRRMETPEAALTVAHRDAIECIAGEISPRELGRRVCRLVPAADYARNGAIRPADEYDGGWGRPACELDEAMRTAARAFAGAHPGPG